MTATTSQAFWITAPGRGEILEEPLPDRAADALCVRTLYTAISRGTEALVWRGGVPPSQYQRMRAPFQAGDFPAPVKYGYCNVGIVEAGPAEWQGRHIFCLYPHQTRYVIPAHAARPLPAELDPALAVLAANTETAINAVWDATPRIGERVVVIGAGVVGALTAAICAQIPGVELTLVDTNPTRADLADALGVTFATPGTVQEGADQVIHASGSAEGLELALSLAADEALITELSWYGDHAPTVPLGEDFHSRRLTLRASQVGQLPPAMRPRWDHGRRLDLALHLLARHPHWAALIDGESPFQALPRVLPRLAEGRGLCHRIRYQE